MGFMGSVAGGFAGLVEEGEVVVRAEDFEFGAEGVGEGEDVGGVELPGEEAE